MPRPRYTFAQKRDIGQTFLIYQTEQPGGLPRTKNDLKTCYLNFCALTPNEPHPSFYEVLNTLIRAKLVGTSRGQVFYLQRVVVDHTVALRARNAEFYCRLCHVGCTSQESLENHFHGRMHRTTERVRVIVGSKEENEKDKEGVTITRPDFGVLIVGTTVALPFKITNTGHSTKQLLAVELVQQTSNLTINPQVRPENAFSLPPGTSQNITLTCKATTLGFMRDILIFRFHGFHIYRYLVIYVDSPGSDLIAPTAPYKRPTPVHREQPSQVIPGVKLSLPSTANQYRKIPQYPIPSILQSAMNHGIFPKMAELNGSNYVSNFSTLLHIEEMQMNVDIRQFDTDSALSKQSGTYNYVLKVPGLAENRPSVIMGDSVFVKVDTNEYEGVVHSVRLNEVFLRFHSSFDREFKLDYLYPIRFSFKRTPIRRMHEAITQSQNKDEPEHWPLLPSVLFPNDSLNANDTNLSVGRILAFVPRISPINRNLNTQQMRAVAAIMRGASRPSPYIVFGPPGTGKTMTIVEAIGQIYLTSNVHEVRILACAPSNNAADLIADRLLSRGVQKRDIYRFNAYNRAFDPNTPQQVQDISSFNPEYGTYNTHPLAQLEKIKVIVSTCVNAGQLYALGVKPFTHIFVDEAGQAMEPECLVALSALVECNTTVVLAGDPKQLGPVIRSPYALLNGQGLGRSLLERLISMHPYRRDPVNFAAYGNYNLRLITKLVNNYRSHPEILLVPNELFYDNELIAMADVVRRTALCEWEGLPTKGFPLVFHGMEGKDEREGNSPSWFNISECMQVVSYVRKLMEHRGTKIDASHIGVITPYRKQAEKIRRLLQGNHINGISVGSVEQFQGQERMIIIVSCVRSNSEFVEFDYKHNLGFLKNPKRFNVAITRPQALLIVIGNPHVLVTDPHWARLFWHIVDHGGYTGCDKPPRGGSSESVDQLISVFNRLQVGENEEPTTMESENPEWRPLH